MSRKALENTNEMCLCPLGILFKSNEFNMAAVSVKRSIGSPNSRFPAVRMTANWLKRQGKGSRTKKALIDKKLCKV